MCIISPSFLPKKTNDAMLAVLAILFALTGARADSEFCHSYYWTDDNPDLVNVTGLSVTPPCSYELMYSISPLTNNFDFIGLINVTDPTSLTFNDYVLANRTFQPGSFYFEDASVPVSFINNLTVSVSIFAKDPATCIRYNVATLPCVLTEYSTNSPVSCRNHFSTNNVNVGLYECEFVTLPYPNAYPYPYYIETTVVSHTPFNASDPNSYFALSESGINSHIVHMTQELGAGGCTTPILLNDFNVNCTCPPPGIYPIRNAVMEQVVTTDQCTGWGISFDTSLNPQTFGFSIPLSSFNIGVNPAINYIEFNLLTTNSDFNILATAAFSDSCDHYVDQATFFRGGNIFDLPPTCGIDAPRLWSWSTSASNSLPVLLSPTSADGSIVVLFKLTGNPTTTIYISSINVSVSVGLNTRVHVFNNQSCGFVATPIIAPEPCNCIGNCSYIADLEGGPSKRRRAVFDYPVQPVDGNQFYYSAPFIVDTGGIADYDGGGGPGRRRIPVSSDQTNAFLNFVFEEDQYIFPYNASYPGAYTIGASLSEEHNCGIHVHVLSCSNNVQVWFRPNLTLDSAPTYYDYGPEANPKIFQCSVVTSADITAVIPLTPNTAVFISDTVTGSQPPQAVWVIQFKAMFPNGTNITLQNVSYGFEIQQPVVNSPDTGIYFRCQIGSPYNGADHSNQYAYNALFAGMNYCQSSDAANGTFTEEVLISLFDSPSVPPVNPPTSPPSTTYRHMHFMAANLCGSTLPMCAADGWRFGEEFEYIPDYVGPAYMFPAGPVNITVPASYIIYASYELDNPVFEEVLNSGQINATSPDFELNLIMNYALNDEFTNDFSGPMVSIVYPDCTRYNCDVIPNILGVQMPILEGFEMFEHKNVFVVDHYKIKFVMTDCITGALAQYLETNNVALNITQLQIVMEVDVGVYPSTGDYGNADYDYYIPFTPYKSVLQRFLLHGMTIDLYPGFTEGNDTRIELLYTPRAACAQAPFPEPLCPSCLSNGTLALPLYRNTVGTVVGLEGCPPFTLQLAPAANHYQSFIGVMIDFENLGLDFVDYTTTSTYANSLANGVFIQIAKVRFVADYSWFQRVASNATIFISCGSHSGMCPQNALQVMYEQYCDVFGSPFKGGPFSGSPYDTPQDPVDGLSDVNIILDDFCGATLFADPTVIEYTIPFFMVQTSYPTIEDKALLVLFRDILPTDRIIIERIELQVGSYNDCITLGGPCTGNYTYNTLIEPTPCREQTTPGVCLCKGCGYAGVGPGDGISGNMTGGVNYFASPVIIDDGIYSSEYPDYAIPEQRRRANPAPPVVESGIAPELNNYFTQKHVIFTYQLNSSIPVANQDDLIGETIVQGCGIYVHNKNCSSNIQVWLNPAAEFYMQLPLTMSDSKSHASHSHHSDSHSHSHSASHQSESKSTSGSQQSQSKSTSGSQQSQSGSLSNSAANDRRRGDAPHARDIKDARRAHGFPFAYEVNAVARCAVTADYNYPLGVFALTDNLVIRSKIVPANFPPAVATPEYIFTQQQWTVDIIYNLTYLTDYLILAQTMGPYGFEIERPMGEGLSGFYVDCDLYMGRGESAGSPVAVPLYLNKSYCEPRRSAVYPSAFDQPFTPLDNYYQIEVGDVQQPAVPRIHLFGTPLCPTVSMCPVNNWFFNAPYNYTEDYLGPAYVFPAYPLNVRETLPFLQTIYFQLNEPNFLALVQQGARKGQQMGMILTLALGESASLNNVGFTILFDETLCGDPACKLNYGGFAFDATQMAILGSGARATTAIYKDHVVLTFIFDEVCFDLFNFTAAADKYMMQLTINGSTVPPLSEIYNRNYTSSIFGRVMLEGVRFFLVETYYDVTIAWQNIAAYQNVLYVPDPDCTRKAFTPSYLCNGRCHLSQLDPSIFPNFNMTNISLITPVTGPYRGEEGGGIDPTYEQLGLNYTLLQQALNVTMDEYYADYGMTNHLTAMTYKAVLESGAQLVINALPLIQPIPGLNVTLAFLTQFNPNITRAWLNNYGNVLAPPFIPGAYVQFDPITGSVNFFGVGVAAGFAMQDGIPLATISSLYVFVTATYDNLCMFDSTYNPDRDVVCNSTSFNELSSITLPKNATILVYGVGEPGYPITIDPTQQPFLDNIGGYGLLPSQYALQFPSSYNLEGANPYPLSFRMGNNWTQGGILGSDPRNKTGIGFFNGTGLEFNLPNISDTLTYAARWLFTADPCVPEAYDPFPYTTSHSQSQTPPLQTHSQSHHSPSHESESHSKSHHSESHHSESHHSESHSKSHESHSHQSESLSHNSQSPSVQNNPEECCNSSVLQVGVTRNEANLCGANPNGIVLPPNGPIYGCSYLDLPPAIYAGGIYQVRDHFVPFNATNPHLNELGRMGLRVGDVWLTFSEVGADIKYFFTPGQNKVIVSGKAWGRINNGTCTLGVIPLHLIPQFYEVHIEITTGMHVMYGAPGDDVNFLVSENATTAPHQRIVVSDSTFNTGYFYPVGHSDWNVSFGLADMAPIFNTIPGLGPLAVDYSPVQFFTAVSLPSVYTGTFTGAGGFQVTCPATGNPNSTRYILHNYACAPFFGVLEQGYGMFMFDVEAACNDCAPTPTPAACPPNETQSDAHPHTYTHTHTRSQSSSLSKSAELQSLSPNPASPTPFPPIFRVFNQSCYTGAMYTKCGLMTPAVFAPDIWMDPAVMYGAIPFPENSPFSDFQMQLIQFNHSIVRAGQRFVKFWVPNMPGRTSVYLTIYMWSAVAVPVNNSEDSYSSDSDWDPSQEGEYSIPPNLVVIVGAGESPRFACTRVADVAKCNVPFPEYGGYLYVGVATQPRYVLPYDVGFVYVEMLMINGVGFDDTFSVTPVIGPPNCVMLNVSVGTPHDPACNLAWDSAVPSLGSNAYSETLASSTVGLFVMGGLGASALAFNIYGVDTASTVWGVVVMGVLNLTAMFFSGTVATVISVALIVGSFGAMGVFLYMKKKRQVRAAADLPINLDMPADEFIDRDIHGMITRHDSMELAGLHALPVVAYDDGEDGGGARDDIVAMYSDAYVPPQAVLVQDEDLFDVEGEIVPPKKETNYIKDVDD